MSVIGAAPASGAFRVHEWGGDAALTALVGARRGELVRVALLIAGDRAAAEDAVSEAVIAVQRTWSTVRPDAGYAYLRTAVVRKALDGRRHTAVGEVPELAVDEPGFLAFEEDRRFFALLQALPPRQRAVLALRYFNGLDTRTVAATLGIAPSAVRSHVVRGLATLRATTRREGEP